jgi:cysteine-rich repeat protein
MLSHRPSRKILLSVVLSLVFVLFFTVPLAFAQDTGLEPLTGVGLTSTDVRTFVGRIVDITLGLLATIAVVIIVYAGFLWMTAGGDSARIDESKSWMKNGAIGLAIILSSWAIVTFIINALLEATQDGEEQWCTEAVEIGTEEGCYDCVDVGGGVPGKVEDLSNAGCGLNASKLMKTGSKPPHFDSDGNGIRDQRLLIRNAVVRMFFNKGVDSATVKDDPGLVGTDTLKVCQTHINVDPDPNIPPSVFDIDCVGNNLVFDPKVAPSVNNTVIEWRPGGDCGQDVDGDGVYPADPDGGDDVCFPSFVRVRVTLTQGMSGILSVSGQDILCSADPSEPYGCYFEFDTNNVIDTDNPVISGMDFSFNGGVNYVQAQGGRYLPADWGTFAAPPTSPIIGQFHATDGDSEVSQVEYFIQGIRDKDGNDISEYRIPTPPPSTDMTAIPSSGIDDTDFPFSDAGFDWDTSTPVAPIADFTPGMTFDIFGKATDMDDHIDEYRKTYELRAAHCFDQLLNFDETGLDCGGVDCGFCNGDVCGIIDTNIPPGDPGYCSSPEHRVCLSGFCNATTCLCDDRPVIKKVVQSLSADPDNAGDIGNWLTIFGSGFGDTSGTVKFMYDEGADNDPVNDTYTTALFPDPAVCGDTWSDTQIIVEVPRLLKNGGATPLTDPELYRPDLFPDYLLRRLKVTSTAGLSDISTSDEYGPYDTGFIYIEDWKFPGLCKLVPVEGEFKSSVTGRGKGFTPVTNPQLIVFGQDRYADVLSWDDDSTVRFNVPNITPQKTTVVVRKIVNLQEKSSNPVEFQVITTPEEKLPIITEIDSPNEDDPSFLGDQYMGWGPKDQLITIIGDNFGDDVGNVDFIHTDGRSGSGTPPENAACSDYWSNTQITIKVPKDYTNVTSVENVIHNIKITTNARYGPLQSDPTRAQFQVNPGVAGPGLCSISPNQGPANNTLNMTLSGENFGVFNNANSQVFFRGSKEPPGFVPSIGGGNTYQWDTDTIEIKVPDDDFNDADNNTVTGLARVVDEFLKGSNGMQFTVGDCRIQPSVCSADIDGVPGPDNPVCCSDGTCKATQADCGAATAQDYIGWVVSTGAFPDTLRVKEQCSTGVEPSPAPNRLNPLSAPLPKDLACQNAAVQVIFNKPTLPPVSNVLFSVQSCGTTAQLTDPSGNGVLDPLEVPTECVGQPAMNLDPAEEITGVCPTRDQNDNGKICGYYTYQNIASKLWNAATWYRVTLGSQITNDAANESLDGNRDGHGCFSEIGVACPEDDYVWYFKTNSEICTLASVNVYPEDATIKEKNGHMNYTGTARADDICIALIPDLYDWEWSVTDTTVAEISPLGIDCPGANCQPNKNIANGKEKEGDTFIYTLVKQDYDNNGTPEVTLIDNDTNLHVRFTPPMIDSKWPDCGNACVNAGIGMVWNTGLKSMYQNNAYFKVYQFSCGNGTKDPSTGEECDDGNIQGGDGCSSVCLAEGTPRCDPERGILVNCCGNNRIEKTSGGGGEQCDDGDTDDGDGCSNACLFNNCNDDGNADVFEACDPTANPSTCSADCRNFGAIAIEVNSVSVTYNPVTPTPEKLQVILNHPQLTKNTVYCVAVSKQVQSLSDVPIYTTSGNFFAPEWQNIECYNAIKTVNPAFDSVTWHFKTKNDANLCEVAKVDIVPASALTRVIGDAQLSRVWYGALPYGKPDECSVNGQILESMSYSWNWSVDQVGGVDVAKLLVPTPGANQFPACGNYNREFGEDGDYGICRYPTNCVTNDDCGRNDVCATGVCAGKSCTQNKDCYAGGICAANKCVYGAEACYNDFACGYRGDCKKPGTPENTYLTSQCVHTGTNAAPNCGNGKLDVGEDCDDGGVLPNDGCGATCLSEGFTFSCGNGIVDVVPLDIREECDDGNKTSGDGCSVICINEGTRSDLLIDPLQQVEAVGLESDAVTQSTTQVHATTAGKTGDADFTIACGYKSDSDCSVFGNFGLGSNTCCYERPDTFSASPSGNGVCRNASIVISFNQPMDTKTFTSNVIVEGYSALDDQCDEFNAPVAAGSPVKRFFIVEWFHWIKQTIAWLFGTESKAAAIAWCPIQGSVSSRGEDTLVFVPKAVFLPSTIYRVRIIGIPNGVKSIHGVTPSWGEKMATQFTTGTKVCTIDTVEVIIDPPSIVDPQGAPKAKENDLFNCTSKTEVDTTIIGCRDEKESTLRRLVGTQHGYVASAKNSQHPLEELTAYYFWKEDPNVNKLALHKQSDKTTVSEHVYETGNQPSFDVNKSFQQVYVTGEADNFESLVTVQAVSTNYAFCPGSDAVYLPFVDCPDPDPAIIAEPTQASKTVNVISFLCENPWPPFVSFPFENDTFDYRTYYCRDAGHDGVKGDLPEIHDQPISVPPSTPAPHELLSQNLLSFYPGYCHIPDDPGTADVDESLLPASGAGCGPSRVCPNGNEVCDLYGYCSKTKRLCKVGDPSTCPAEESCQTSGDAIGLRSYENTYYYSPLKWYRATGLSGKPQKTEPLDGFETLQDENTLYVNIAYGDLPPPTDLKTGIQLFSVNSDANANTQNIYSQLLRNLTLGKEYTNNRICSLTGNSCNSDYDCFVDAYDPANPGDNICSADKQQIQRDVVRLADRSDMLDSLSAYKQKFGTFPTLTAGTYLQGNTLSLWPSWNETLNQELIDAETLPLPVDSINRFFQCPAGSDQNTCWDEETRNFQCPEQWWGYWYHFVNADRSEAFVRMERPDYWDSNMHVLEDIGDICTGGNRQGEGGQVIADYDGDGRENDQDNCVYVRNGDDCLNEPFTCDIDLDGKVGNPNIDPANADRVIVRAIEGTEIENPQDYDYEYNLGWMNDEDSDGIGDACDRCWKADGTNTGQDDEKDEFCYLTGDLTVGDSCPLIYNPTQADYDGDAYLNNCNRDASPYKDSSNSYCGGDACDLDADNDGYLIYNDCQETDTYPECRPYRAPEPEKYAVTVNTLDDGIPDEIGVWVFQGQNVYDDNPNTTAQDDERRGDFLFKRGMSSNVPLVLPPTAPGAPDKYTIRIRSRVNNNDPNAVAAYRMIWGTNLTVGRGVNKVHVSDFSCLLGNWNKTEGPQYIEGEICLGGGANTRSGMITILVEANYPPNTSSRCSPYVHPGVIEICDGVDNDCDGNADRILVYRCSISGHGCDPQSRGSCAGDGGECQLWKYRNLCSPDLDHDGWSLDNGDCNDNDADMYQDTYGETHGKELFGDAPGANDFCKDTKDNDCDGDTDWSDFEDCQDRDNDLWADFSTVQGICSGNPALGCDYNDVHACNDGADGVCGTADDCNDGNVNMNPDKDEDCDDFDDNDCDGKSDLGDEDNPSGCNVGLADVNFYVWTKDNTHPIQADDAFEVVLEPITLGNDRGVLARVELNSNSTRPPINQRSAFIDGGSAIKNGRYTMKVYGIDSLNQMTDDPYNEFFLHISGDSKVNFISRNPRQTSFYVTGQAYQNTDLCRATNVCYEGPGATIEARQLPNLLNLQTLFEEDNPEAIIGIQSTGVLCGARTVFMQTDLNDDPNLENCVNMPGIVVAGFFEAIIDIHAATQSEQRP